MQSETRQCQNCKQSFAIEPEDFNFYKKIGVPPPTFCPDCRTVRRISWRNEMSLFRRKCDAPGHDEDIISMYPPDEKLKTYDSSYWWSDNWDQLSYGRDYDFSKPFFQQWSELYRDFPQQALSNIHAVNSDYCNVAEDSRESYMSSGSWKIERTFYSNRISETKDCSDTYVTHKSELCYEDMFCEDCYRLMYSMKCKACVDSYFLYDCHGCTNCLGCTNQRNKSYCMWNEPLSKEEYTKRLSEIDLTSYAEISKLKEKFDKLVLGAVNRFANQIRSINSTGDNLDGVKNCHIIFDGNGNIEDCKFAHWVAHVVKDGYDIGPGLGDAELAYEAFDTGIGNYRNLFTSVVYSSNNVEYSFNCHGCSDLFGCIGIRNKKHCILNKEYSKEEYEALVPKIKEHMMNMPYVDRNGLTYKYGEFFPAELSPFCYNETQAQDYFPLTKEEALSRGYRWRDKKQNEYSLTIEAKDLPDRLGDVRDSILSEVIGCANRNNSGGRCRGAFKITDGELKLYKKLGVPLPHLCFFCRHEARLAKRNPMKLWHRSCMCQKAVHSHAGKCLNEFDTAFAPDRPETVYCEDCYNKEVY